MSPAPSPTRLQSISLLCLLLVLASGALSGCDEQRAAEAERQEVQQMLQTGAELSVDPYMQAETMRVLNIINQPALNHLAEPLVSDKSPPMVRVAALRVLLANDFKDAQNLVSARFERAEPPEQHAILEAVHQLGSARLLRVLVSRALNSPDPDLRRDAFSRGPLARLREAQRQEKTIYLRDTLFPELGQFIDEEDPALAAMALNALLLAGEEERAEPLLKTLNDATEPSKKRIAAAKILAAAGVEEAKPAFQRILRSVRVSSTGELVLPRRIDQDLVRQATLGMVALGDEAYIQPVQKYLEKADADQTLEVLRALSKNPAEDALISLKVAMHHARPRVRDQAIELYLAHPEAQAKDLIEVMDRSNFETQIRLAHALSDAYPREWARHLSAQLNDPESSLKPLELLWNTLLLEPQHALLEHLQEPLQALARGEHEAAAPRAALLLVMLDDDPALHELLRAEDNPRIRYAYLEYLAREAPRENIDFFRQNLRTDLHTLRLMSAAGILLAVEEGAPSADIDPPPSEIGEGLSP